MSVVWFHRPGRHLNLWRRPGIVNTRKPNWQSNRKVPAGICQTWDPGHLRHDRGLHKASLTELRSSVGPYVSCQRPQSVKTPTTTVLVSVRAMYVLERFSTAVLIFAWRGHCNWTKSLCPLGMVLQNRSTVFCHHLLEALFFLLSWQ